MLQSQTALSDTSSELLQTWSRPLLLVQNTDGCFVEEEVSVHSAANCMPSAVILVTPGYTWPSNKHTSN